MPLPQLPREEPGKKSKPRTLEVEFDSQLNAAWASAAQERVAYTHIASGSDGIGSPTDFTAGAMRNPLCQRRL